MTRKEMIIIAAVVNAGLLAILFMTAGNLDEAKYVEPLKEESYLQTSPPVFSSSSEEKKTVEMIEVPLFEEKEPALKVASDTPVLKEEAVKQTEKEFVEVVVKRGDFLQKIAKQNGTSVEAIKKANGLKGEKIAVGQVLKIPVTLSEVKHEPSKTGKEEEIEGAVYYTIKSGDNPWKLARQFQVPFEELLRLNHLDEEKARNLKIGDQIRVR